VEFSAHRDIDSWLSNAVSVHRIRLARHR